jgi:hypothetical protein
MINPDLRARLTASSAVLADFQRERERFCDRRGPEPSAIEWCGRLEDELESVLAGLRHAVEMLDDNQALFGRLDKTGSRSDGGLSVAYEDTPATMRALSHVTSCPLVADPRLAAICGALATALGKPV